MLWRGAESTRAITSVADEGDSGTTDATIHPLLGGIKSPQYNTLPLLHQQLAPLAQPSIVAQIRTARVGTGVGE